MREPDLHVICRFMGLVLPEIFGRNWLAHLSARLWVFMRSALFNLPLTLRPRVCSDTYLLTQRPAA